MKVVVLLLAGLTLTSFLFDVAFRQWLRWRLHEQLEKNRGLRTLTWSMRLRHLLLGALILALIASVGRTTQDRWIIFGATSVVVLPLVGAALWFNAQITRVLRQRTK